MISFTTGNILESASEAIVNTVNCEGYMGKGIAYQFKLKYPQNNKKYEEICNSGKMQIGTLLTFEENDKLIINFPTKDQWRKKSEYSFISKGLDSFIKLLPKLHVSSIAFPPLGCGNGGLEWSRVKALLLEAITPFEDSFNFELYEPTNNISVIQNKKKIPKLNTSHIILMHLKLGLKKFNKTRLQKAAFFVNIFAKEEYFKFNAYNYGPYNHTIDIIGRDIREYQQYYNYSTDQALTAAENTLISRNLIEKLERFGDPILAALNLLNQIDADRDLELISTIVYILTEKKAVKIENFTLELQRWSEEKANRFSELDIQNQIKFLKSKNIVVESLLGIELNYKL